ncbi:MAG TPA: hypothetical protein VFQ47_01420 [Nitrososphaera sp.]|nr:hypothetical protein [Nitrososphaera sp.]
MVRLLSVLCLALMLISVQSQAKDNVSYEKFLTEAMADFGPRATCLNEEYKLGSYRWDLDQTTGKLVFSDGGIPKVIADAQIVGSYSTYSHTWMWSWANETVDENMKKDMGKIKKYGEQHNFKELVTAKWECDEDYGWKMTAAAGYLLKAKRAYRGPIEDGYVYMLIMDINRADDK